MFTFLRDKIIVVYSSSLKTLRFNQIVEFRVPIKYLRPLITIDIPPKLDFDDLKNVLFAKIRRTALKYLW